MLSDLMRTIYDQLDRETLLAELNPQGRGNVLTLTCPSCGQREAYLYRDGTRILCNRRNKCGYSASLWDYIAARDALDPQGTLMALAKAAHVTLPERGEASPTYARELSRQALLARAIESMRAALFTPEGKATLTYLIARGWTEETARAAGFGHYPRQGTLKKLLAQDGADLTAIDNDDFSLFSPASLGDTHTLAIPYYDAYGRPEGVIVRAIAPLGEQGRKYLFNRGVKRGAHFFHLEAAGRTDTLIVVEGYIDALMADAVGIGAVVATGGSRVTRQQLDEAIRRGVKRFVLALDNAEMDKAGREGALAAIQAIHQAGGRAYVSPLPAGYKDPDELMRSGKDGVEAFKQSLAEPRSAASWAAEMLLAEYGLPLPVAGQMAEAPTDKLLRDKVLDDAMAFARAFTDPISPADYLEPIALALGLPRQTLQLEYEAYTERIQHAAKNDALKKLSVQIAQRVHEDATDDLSGAVRTQLDEIDQRYDARILRPYTLDALSDDLKNAPDGLRTGFTSLDKLLTIPQGAITLVAARPSHGKTTMLTNLFLRMIAQYPEDSFAFFSYEETRAALAVNMINILGGKKLNDRKNKYAISQYFARGGTDLNGRKVPELDRAWQTFGELVDSGRLQLFEESLDADTLAAMIVREKRKNPRLKAVFIDYLQKVRWSGAQAPSRQVELQRISGRLLDAAKAAGIPVILAAQLGRPAKGRDAKEDTRKGVRLDNLRESGDMEQDANLVLGLFNEAMHQSEEDGGEVDDKNQHITVTILKNRNGMAGATIPMRFEPQILTILDENKGAL